MKDKKKKCPKCETEMRYCGNRRFHCHKCYLTFEALTPNEIRTGLTQCH